MDQTYLETIKRLGIVAMFADDELMEKLVLKGGNVLDVVHQISTRPSADLDFSIDGDFADASDAEKRIKQTLTKTFAGAGLVAFDINFRAVPPNLTPDRTDFWGGYKVDFKLIEQAKFEKLGGDPDRIRRSALTIGKAKSGSSASTKFGIDLSKHEYCEGKEVFVIDGYSIFVYSPTMFVCEKLRAICQQMPEYVAIVQSHPSGRARDFVDIHVAAEHFGVRFDGSEVQPILRRMFERKRVPLKLIGQIGGAREFHRESFQTVRDTVKPGVTLQEYDFYFDYVLRRSAVLEPLWNI